MEIFMRVHLQYEKTALPTWVDAVTQQPGIISHGSCGTNLDEIVTSLYTRIYVDHIETLSTT